MSEDFDTVYGLKSFVPKDLYGLLRNIDYIDMLHVAASSPALYPHIIMDAPRLDFLG
jgi:hypothetical protein